MRASRWVSGLLAGALLAGCIGPRFQVRAPPMLPREVPAAPTAPEAREVRAAAPGTRGTVTAALPLPDLRAQTVALVVGGTEESRAAALALLPRMMIGARFTRVVYPVAMQQVQGTFERGSGGPDRTTVTGALHQLALLQARTPAEQLVMVEVSGPSAGEQVRERHFEVPADALASYRQAWESFRAALEGYRRRLREVAGAYRAEVSTARDSYEARGGQYQTPEEHELRERVDAWNAQVALLEATAANRERAARSPEDVAAQATIPQGQERRPVYAVDVRAVVTDLRAGQTYWLDEVHAEAPTAADALREALGRLLQDLGAAPVAAPAVAPTVASSTAP